MQDLTKIATQSIGLIDLTSLNDNETESKLFSYAVTRKQLLVTLLRFVFFRDLFQ